MPTEAHLLQHRRCHVDFLARAIVALRVQRHRQRSKRLSNAQAAQILGGYVMDDL